MGWKVATFQTPGPAPVEGLPRRGAAESPLPVRGWGGGEGAASAPPGAGSRPESPFSPPCPAAAGGATRAAELPCHRALAAEA